MYRFLDDFMGLAPRRCDYFLDIGCGVANLLPYVAMCKNTKEALGVEITPDLVEIANNLLAVLSSQSVRFGLRAPYCQVLCEDFRQSTRVKEFVKKANLIVCNNFGFAHNINEKG